MDAPHTFEDIKRNAVQGCLERHAGNQAATARELDIHIDTLRSWLKAWEITRLRKIRG